MSYALGIDSSTQSCSALVVDIEKLSVVAEASVNFGQHLPQYRAPNGYVPDGCNGEVMADPMMWLDALDKLMTDLSARVNLANVRAVCGAGQQHGSVYLNAQWFDCVAHLDPHYNLAEQLAVTLSRTLSPIWMDHSTSAECAEIAACLGGNDEVCKRSGSIVTERFTGPQIRRFYKCHPHAYQNTARIHLVSSFLASVLAGADAPIDTGDGAGMNLLNIHNQKWDPSLLKATAPELQSKLPTVVNGDHHVGSVANYFQQKYGFSANVPVVVFSGDNPSSLVGMGAGHVGQVVISLGTSDTFFAPMSTNFTHHCGSGHIFGNPLGGMLSLQCFTNGSLAREAVRDRFGLDWQGFSSLLETTPIGNNGRIMLPFFTAETSPRINCTNPILHGDPEFVEGRNPSAWVRACIEGQFLNMRLQTRWMGLNAERILLTGGASANAAIAQVIADVFQCPVQRLMVANSVALGSVLRAASVAKLAALPTIEAAFCKVVPGNDKIPQTNAAPIYQLMEQQIEKLLNAAVAG
jgi:xylulokinase